MDALTLARLQFGIITIYHFFFVPLSLGLSLMVAIMETIYVLRGDEKYKGHGAIEPRSLERVHEGDEARKDYLQNREDRADEC